MANVVARIPGARAERLILASHYDTKLFRDFRFVGANDGGSSTAMLLELARVLKARKNPFTIELVFFDGEESVIEWTGDRPHLRQPPLRRRPPSATARSALRAGDGAVRHGRRPPPDHQARDRLHRWLTDLIWASARRLGQQAFLAEDFAVEDDHRPFLDAGHPRRRHHRLDYDAWHTKDDTLDQVSARSLQTVGDVFLGALPQIEARLRR